MNLIHTANIIVPYFIIMIIGYSARDAVNRCKGAAALMNRFVFRVAMPCKLFYSVYSAEASAGPAVRLYAYVVVEIFAVVILSGIVVNLLNMEPSDKSVQIQNAFRCNYLIFGTSIVEAVYGNKGLEVAAGLAVVVIPLINVMAVVVLSVYNGEKKKPNRRELFLKIVKNPLIIGVLSGFLLKMLHAPLPQFLLNTASSLGNCSTPVAFLALGATYSFSFMRQKENLQQITAGTFVRLILIPAIGMLIAVKMGFRNEQLLALLMVTGTPVAVSSYIMAEEMGANGKLASQLVVSSSFFGMFSLFIFIFILKSLHYII